MTPLNSNGFVPGEAGAAVMVEPGSPSWPTELRILGTGLAREESTIASDRPLRGEGITRAARGALLDAGLDIHDTSYRITDLSGEHYKFKEAAFVAGRFLRRPLPKLYDLWHPIEFIGETGAANVPISLALAFHAGQKQYANGPRTLMHFGNDDGERAAAVTEYVTRV
jgi:3-oxoacyl-[acyl-carrier-protein] synthase-1